MTDTSSDRPPSRLAQWFSSIFKPKNGNGTEALREAIVNNLLKDTSGSAAGEGNARDTPAASANPDELFRAEVAAWMRDHLCGDFEPLRFRGGPGDEEALPELRKAWERELAAGGWTCVGWPESAGGRGLSIEQQVIFHEEYARAGGPGRLGHIGEGLIGPTLIRFGSAEQKERFLPGIVSGREFWAQGYSEPSAGSDLANVQTRCWQDEDGHWRATERYAELREQCWELLESQIKKAA